MSLIFFGTMSGRINGGGRGGETWRRPNVIRERANKRRRIALSQASVIEPMLVVVLLPLLLLFGPPRELGASLLPSFGSALSRPFLPLFFFFRVMLLLFFPQLRDSKSDAARCDADLAWVRGGEIIKKQETIATVLEQTNAVSASWSPNKRRGGANE